MKIEPLEKAFVISTIKPAIPKNIPITMRNELETAFTGVMLLIPHINMIKPRKHKTIPTRMPLISNLSTNYSLDIPNKKC